ncbi:Cytochrome P450 [Tylopilus felleus]
MSELWLTFRKWAQAYSDIVHFQRLDEDMIIINSEKIAKDLLDRETSNSSDRPSIFFNELSGSDYATGLLPYGDPQRFLPYQHQKACQLLRQLFSTPKQFDEHVVDAYDYDQPSHPNDEFLKSVVKVKAARVSVLRPNITIIVSTFPILLKLLAWFPSMSFKNDMEIVKKLTKQFVEMAFEYTLQRVRCAIHATRFTVNMEERKATLHESWVKGLKEAAASILGGMELSNVVLLTFFLVMALNPAVQEKVQAEIDVVVGKDRLPTLDNRPLLCRKNVWAHANGPKL